MSTITATLETLGLPQRKTPWDWNDEGVVVLKSFFTANDLVPYTMEWMDEHCRAGTREKVNGKWHWNGDAGGGWSHATPYMEHPALRALLCNAHLDDMLRTLIGETAGVHLNLTGWRSTERDWHQDNYLNPPHVGDRYVAVWIALDDIDPDSGPFQYVPGSHRWPQVTQDVIARYYDLNDPQWPKQSEAMLTRVFEDYMQRVGVEPVTYVPKRGDVLFWHARLLHRGARPRVHGLERRALIAHYSGIHHRPDMPPAEKHALGGYFFPISGAQPVR